MKTASAHLFKVLPIVTILLSASSIWQPHVYAQTQDALNQQIVRVKVNCFLTTTSTNDVLSTRVSIPNLPHMSSDHPQNNCEQEWKNYIKSLPITSENADIYYERGSIRNYYLGDVQGAIEDYTQAIQLNPNFANVYYERGLTRYKLGENQKAIEDYTQAIELNPNFADAYYERGSVRNYSLGDLQGAIEDYTQSINLNPKNTEAYYERGLARYYIGDKQGAKEDYAQVILLNPNNTKLFYSSHETGSTLVSHDNQAESLYKLGVRLFKKGDKTGAIQKLQEALAIFQVREDRDRYRDVQNLISRLKP
ncbi:MAG: hypothetical protein NVSMB70_06840 [Chamaesiphon sp.]